MKKIRKNKQVNRKKVIGLILAIVIVVITTVVGAMLPMVKNVTYTLQNNCITIDRNTTYNIGVNLMILEVDSEDNAKEFEYYVDFIDDKMTYIYTGEDIQKALNTEDTIYIKGISKEKYEFLNNKNFLGKTVTIVVLAIITFGALMFLRNILELTVWREYYTD